MCELLVINRGEKEIETPRQFAEHFGYFPATVYDNIIMDSCLCGFDLDSTFQQRGIEYARDGGDYFVGDLIEVDKFDFYFNPLTSQ